MGKLDVGNSQFSHTVLKMAFQNSMKKKPYFDIYLHVDADPSIADGSYARPFATIQDAIESVPNKPLIITTYPGGSGTISLEEK